ncbi:MAG: signal peptidase II [Piscirickettsiaceae bacterium CG_4_9_14_3_um_filter_43_564]|nr:lipoprotein signal peptidase [Thiomicrospira sp.]OIP94013.1 MAG: signal peptidase II [Thiomicrospira sp. CG2_30_44_34]PIQ05457.1 MAG: signal peptidase II [Piscirickettsiaceae bacterium CG18_big_fil_WC_8_21_14_2_50_44_103]PIU39276.1 MAG: signal peptidase II [Piscirickettsiaceae bacterium CG07_land_8_20_14_0_80_44_28]PIW58312.1 MAG: signal peptidase II [Piscirickettsiaceae bacterium CG12_big_fil_rev_8_21_14_0_65_44_934]PIW77041.1 MAG: signal peptidase II [Piscirickettsiaceae bacterium CG_4_8_
MNVFSQTSLKTVWLAIILLVVDQLTKYWVNQTLILGEPIAIMPFLNFTLAYNDGAAFSFLADMGGWQRWFFSGLAFVVGAGLLIWLTKLPKAWTVEVVGINLILSGAVGNLMDRVLAGRVTDFIDFYIGNWHYATFNIADIAITLGAAMLLYAEFWLKSRQSKIAS